MRHDAPSSSRHARPSEVGELPQSAPEHHGAMLASTRGKEQRPRPTSSSISDSPLREGFRSWDFGRALDVLPSLVPLGGIYLGVGCANSGGADVIAALGTEVGLQPAPTSLSRHADHVGEGIGRFRGVVRDDLGLGARPRKVISTPIDSGICRGRSRSAMYARSCQRPGFRWVRPR